MRVAVNISAAQLTGAGLAETVLGALAATRLEPGRLELEVTESVFLGDDAATLASLERLRALGVRLVLDDFGKGYQLVRLFEPRAFLQDQDRPELRPRCRRGRSATASPSSTPSSPWPAAWASKRPPKASRPRRRPTSCAQLGCTSCRASISAGRCRAEAELQRRATATSPTRLIPPFHAPRGAL